ncbi:bifunctional 3-deoxy-7-phosphoheptulonate synthase/chorismate mutase type II [Corallococcus exercitus]|uniref:chorismate mutase n=1 Tax=Corallococcus exercitus TaxID=2316736 RepID=A0A7Y4NRW4_9BACT|nr:chorismate mutase [Corallococcus exercitus]NOK33337.1 bifunctional 3-deoxy-7-phosphoheptulonate synthase/chorismate mutase type II [Corallococcus exercitus]
MKPLDLQLVPPERPMASIDRPMIIAGPCAAETEEQVMATAIALDAIPAVTVFRAGIWKPRTRPGAFEGVGTVGLKWLARVRRETRLLVAVEVANAQHVEEALAHGIDVQWIGARTTANPFSVQEIADALRGVPATVLVKNPISPDLSLWIGALERVNRAGIGSLLAVHRGFSMGETNGYRNSPHWQIPIQLRRLAPTLPVLCDPSHISGDRRLLPEVAQRAMDLDMAGLMIETHVTPEAAWSDASQQITPDALVALLAALVLRRPSSQDPQFADRLELLRRRIDRLDADLLQTLAERMAVVRKIGEIKAENSVTPLQLERWNAVVESRLLLGKQSDLGEDFVLAIFQAIHEEALRTQTGLEGQARSNRVDATPAIEVRVASNGTT